MKLVPFIMLMLSVHGLAAQSLPITFESGNVTTGDFTDFDGGTATVVANPTASEANPSETVAQIVRSGGAIWSGSKLTLDAPLDFSTESVLSMQVLTSAPVGTTVKFKLEGNGETERDAQTTVSGQWETLSWDFTGVPTGFTDLVFMFDFGNVGDGTANSTFFFDNVVQSGNGLQLDWPVTFDESGVNYTLSDFGGNVSRVIDSPFESGNQIAEVVKANGAATWAGTTIGTPAGFATNIPLTLDNSKMYVRVWSPETGVFIRLKVEDSDDPTHTCETQTLTTVAGDWETLEFDFTNQAPGTELLEIGLQMGWTYNMASIFFDFGNEGTAAEKTYYFDNVAFAQPIDVTTSVKTIDTAATVSVFPNPTSDRWVIETGQAEAASVELFDLSGRLIATEKLEVGRFVLDAGELASGNYFAVIRRLNGETLQTLKLVRE